MARFADLDPLVLYRILRLRAEVFAVEQQCAYNDLDGRDTEPGTWHLWIDAEDEPTPACAARLLTNTDGSRVLGRVVTAAGRRRQGLAGAVIDRALTLVAPGQEVLLNAQSQLERWYARWGFVREGPDFLEDGIPHVPMRRASR